MSYGKILITGDIKSLSGMHIGGMDRFSAIGSIDSFVVRDTLTNQPMIPGSSLKGKIRYLLGKKYVTTESLQSKNTIEYLNKQDVRIRRLFGSTLEKEKIGRLIFSDCFLDEACVGDLKKKDVPLTEVKAENVINRLTAVAMPRFIERSVRGAIYNMKLVYTFDIEDETRIQEILEDFALVKEGMDLLESDYLGGSGSRGYGKVKFGNIDAKLVAGELPEDIFCKCQSILKGDEGSAL
ncbi:MAG: type III-A CRISPR-associated RAMP protein Csm3 [Clostridiales bacterium]|nr:type III-A CRISPR-associated RAMP protein Csm3 [Clostridiales bacterium]